MLKFDNAKYKVLTFKDNFKELGTVLTKICPVVEFHENLSCSRRPCLLYMKRHLNIVCCLEHTKKYPSVPLSYLVLILNLLTEKST